MSVEKYMGLNIAKNIGNPLKSEKYLIYWDQLHINYDDNVDWELLRKEIILCDETRDYLYRKPEPVRYVQGTRPELEKIVYETVEGANTDREKILCLMVFCRDLYKKHRTGQAEVLFFGGTEEELIKKGETLCECLGRLMVSLCEILGFPGRVVTHVVGGHIVCEIYFEERWAYIDPRAGLFYLDENDKFLSIDEIIKDRSVIRNQKDWVKNYISDLWTYEYRENQNYDVYMHPNGMQCFAEYSLMDADEYHFDWKYMNAAERDGLFNLGERRIELNELILQGK